jgi:hypothetical protein
VVSPVIDDADPSRRTRTRGFGNPLHWDVSDIVGLVLYLESAPFVTGEMHVDGGESGGNERRAFVASCIAFIPASAGKQSRFTVFR